MVTANRIRTLVLIGLVALSLLLFGGLTLTANAVKSELRAAENRIIALRTRKMMLETELETRANQRQLADWNAVDFGYRPPRAAQFLESERQLASLGAIPGPGAPAPIRAATYQDGDATDDFAMASVPAGETAAETAFAAPAIARGEEDKPVVSRLAAYIGGNGRIALTARSGVAE